MGGTFIFRPAAKPVSFTVEIGQNNQTITFTLPDSSFVNVSEINDILRVNNYYGIITVIN
jgi:hypothetical protein